MQGTYHERGGRLWALGFRRDSALGSLKPGPNSFPSHWIFLFTPIADAAVHRNHVCITHFLKIVGGQCRAKSSAAIEDQRRVQIRHTGFDVPLDHAFAKMNCAGEMVFRELAFLTNINQHELLAVIEFLFDFVDVGFFDSRSGVIHDVEKTWCMLHKCSLIPSFSSQFYFYVIPNRFSGEESDFFLPRARAFALASKAFGSPTQGLCPGLHYVAPSGLSCAKL